MKYVLRVSLQPLCDTLFILRRSERHKIENACQSSCKVRLILSDFNETWIFSIDFSKNPQITNLIKFPHLVSELFHSDGRKGGRTWRS